MPWNPERQICATQVTNQDVSLNLGKPEDARQNGREDVTFSWPAEQERTGPLLVVGLPHFKGISGQLLAGLAPTDVCQSTTDFLKVSGLPRHGL